MDSNGETILILVLQTLQMKVVVCRRGDTTFSVMGVAANNNQYAHTFVSATAGALIKQNGTVTVNVGASPSNNQYAPL